MQNSDLIEEANAPKLIPCFLHEIDNSITA